MRPCALRRVGPGQLSYSAPLGLVAVKATHFRWPDPSEFKHEERAWALLLRATLSAPAGRIKHLPLVLRHRSLGSTPADFGGLERASLVKATLAKNGNSDWSVVAGDTADTLRIVHPLPSKLPLVSIIILTRDRPLLLRNCLDGLLFRTTYPALEIIIVDNGSEEPETRLLLSDLAKEHGVIVIRNDSPFHWSALNHVGLAASQGEVILLLNNDTDVIGPDWLREMVSHAIRSDVGLVGAKLLYPSGTIQHAGIALDEESAWHVWRNAPGESPGYLSQLSRTRTVSAVTGACIAMRRAV